MKMRWKRSYFVYILLTVTLFASYYYTPRRRQLLDHSVKIADIEWAGHTDDWFTSFWINSSQLVYFHAPNRFSRQWYLYDLRTNQSLFLSKFNSLIERSLGYHSDWQSSGVSE